jgi:hypothetical protein
MSKTVKLYEFIKNLTSKSFPVLAKIIKITVNNIISPNTINNNDFWPDSSLDRMKDKNR